ncbi:hypothetical protein [Kitasatospora sp. NPDC051705]|uniref:hypothetical protein n=1 Tax=Kitasatospora sp. NPDC051705 TaxID=3364057 RepID=UPI00378941ED
MTDKNPRPKSGDRGGGGPAETPTERLLREAMNARASLITVHDLRPADPPTRRLRRLRPLYLATVPVLALAAALAIGVLTLHGDPLARKDVPPPAATGSATPSPTASPTGTPTPTPTPTVAPSDTGAPTGEPETGAPLSDVTPTHGSTPTPTGTTPAAAGKPYTFRNVRFKVPAGWRVVEPSPGDTALCVMSPGAPPASSPNPGLPVGANPDPCQPYGVLLVVMDQPSENWPSTAMMDTASGWSPQPACPVWGNVHAPAGQEAKSTGPEKSTPTVAGRPARKSQWQGSCGSDSFTAQMWALPKDGVFVTTAGLKADYQAGLNSLLGSLDLSGHQAPPTAANQNDVAVTFDGLAAGQPLRAGSAVVTFSVTFRNTSQNTYARLQPLVFTDHYEGSPLALGAPNDGRLELQTGGEWKKKAMSPDSLMGYALADETELFKLAPGESRTLTYRLTVGAGNGLGDMPLKAQAVLPYNGSDLTLLGHQDMTVKIVK